MREFSGEGEGKRCEGAVVFVASGLTDHTRLMALCAVNEGTRKDDETITFGQGPARCVERLSTHVFR